MAKSLTERLNDLLVRRKTSPYHPAWHDNLMAVALLAHSYGIRLTGSVRVDEEIVSMLEAAAPLPRAKRERGTYVSTRRQPSTLDNALLDYEEECAAIVRMEVQIEYCRRRMKSLKALHPKKDATRFNALSKRIPARVQGILED